MSEQPAVEAVDLVKHFGPTVAVDGVSFTVPRGTVLGLLGPNGAGKTTTVRMLTTLSQPTSGTGRVAGHDIRTEAAAVRRAMGLTGQAATVDELLTARENLWLIGRLAGLPKRAIRTVSDDLLERFSLTDAATRVVKTYSGGMRRRLDLAVSLIATPPVLFLDEPTTGLDPRSRNDLWDVLRGLVRDGTTLVLTTQYLEEADQLAHDLVVLDHGRVIASGTAAELKSRAGGRRLFVRPELPHDAALVAAVVAAETGEPPAVEPSGEVTAASTEAGAIRRVEDRLDAEGVAVAEIGLRLPSLDDVFLSLTGHASEPDHPSAPEPVSTGGA